MSITVPPPPQQAPPLAPVGSRASPPVGDPGLATAVGESAGRPSRRLVVPRSVAIALGFAGALVLLQVWAIRTQYALRVTSDMPTYLALIRGLIAHPFAVQSPFLAAAGIASPHATPDMVLIAKLWAALAPPGKLSDPSALGTYLGVVGIVISWSTLGMVVLYARRVGGRGTGLLTAGVLLVMFGPAHVIWANDLTFHSFLYASFYPQNTATALALGTLLALRGRGRSTLALATVLAGLTMIVHPLTGTLMAGLACAQSCQLAMTGRPGAYRASFALIGGFLAATAWPDYELNRAMLLAGIPGSVLIAGCAALPRVAALTGPLVRRAGGLRRGLARLADALTTPRAAMWFALAGAAVVAIFAVWEIVLIQRGPTDPLVHSNRLAVYWGEDRWRWFLMFAAGWVGLPGLIRLARREQPLPLLWFAGCYGVALLGLVGVPIPVWWRFLLLAEIPLALGVAVVLTERPARSVRWITTSTLSFALEFKLLTLLVLPTSITYFGSGLQSTYSLGRLIPPSPPGLVAADPFTSYYIPAATGRRVLTVTKAHVGSQAELDAASHGYDLLHGLYVAGATSWWARAQALWQTGVRFVLLQKNTTLAPPTLEDFSTGPTPLLRTQADRAVMGRMHWRLRRVGRLVADGPEYALYALNGPRLFGSAAAARAASAASAVDPALGS